ncbi:MAG: squalene/phytoene synthase family protein, partial [Pseudomonadota bacterium]
MTRTTEDIVAYSRDRIERGSKSFAGAARLFDADTRASAYMLYAWCRHCDDVIDGQDLGRDVGEGTGEAQRAVLTELIADTRAALDGSPYANTGSRFA